MDDYELLDFGEEEKLERWGKYVLRRPDQNATGQKTLSKSIWDDVHLFFHRDSKNEEYWERCKETPHEWTVKYRDLTFAIKPTAYKHTGLFPEQTTNWDWIIEQIKRTGRQIKVLNLFAYTGGATIAAAWAGAEVTHIDSSNGANFLAKENQRLSNLTDKKIRIITEDVRKFVEKELKRGNKYDVIIMDPPLFGHGPKGQIWKIEKDLIPLIQNCLKLLSQKPAFMLINLYAGNNLEHRIIPLLKGKIEVIQLDLSTTSSKKVLHTGNAIRVELLHVS